MYMLEDAKPPK